jgi:hypothetical protein
MRSAVSLAIEQNSSLLSADIAAVYKVGKSTEVKRECQTCKRRAPATSSNTKAAVCSECGTTYLTDSTSSTGTTQKLANTYAQMMGKGNNVDLKA